MSKKKQKKKFKLNYFENINICMPVFFSTFISNMAPNRYNLKYVID